MNIRRSLHLLAFVIAATAHAERHVFVVVEENHSFKQVIGGNAMPYLKSLAKSYGLAKNYFAVTHPSIGNYFSLTTGDIITNRDRYSATVYRDNIVRNLIKAGKTWKEYSEDLPSVGYTGGNFRHYTQHHNPLSYFSDVRDNIMQRQNLVPFTQLAEDISNDSLPNFGFIVPNDLHNGHDAGLGPADIWLETNIAPLIAKLGRHDLLIITFDEASGDSPFNGGRIPWIVVGPSVKRQYRSTTPYMHPSTLRFICERLDIGIPKSARTAPRMNEFLSP